MHPKPGRPRQLEARAFWMPAQFRRRIGYVGSDRAWPQRLYDATGETSLLEYAKNKIVEVMAPHVSHTGVHDHGFNNVSTYGNLLRLMKEGKIETAWRQSREGSLAAPDQKVASAGAYRGIIGRKILL